MGNGGSEFCFLSRLPILYPFISMEHAHSNHIISLK